MYVDYPMQTKGPDRISSVFWPAIEIDEEPIFH